jgi:hypothetical protein
LSAPSNDLSPIRKLATGLQCMILQSLTTNRIKNIRLASRSWSAATIESFLRGRFSVRLNEKSVSRIDFLDLAKLERLCRHPLFSKDIRYLKFHGYDMSRDMFLHRLRIQKRMSTRKQWEAVLYPRTSKSGEQGKEEKVDWPTQDDWPTQGDCNRSILEMILPELPNFFEICIPAMICRSRDGDPVLNPC